MASPFVKWAGGKTRLVPFIAAQAGLFGASRYIEPFLGGGAMYFGLRKRGLAAPAALTDLNAELIQAYMTVRDDVEELIAALAPIAERYAGSDATSRESMYYEVRGSKPTTAVETAARLIFLNRTCFNGLYRVNRRGEFNVPHGDYANPAICTPEGLRQSSLALKGADLRTGDFAIACREAGAGDFVYLDPPYQPLSPTSNFTAYTGGGFGIDEQRRLAAAVQGMVSRGALVILSNSAHPGIEQLYAGFHVSRVQMARNINSVGKGRRPVEELVISNFELRVELPELRAEAQMQPDLQIA